MDKEGAKIKSSPFHFHFSIQVFLRLENAHRPVCLAERSPSCSSVKSNVFAWFDNTMVVASSLCFVLFKRLKTSVLI